MKPPLCEELQLPPEGKTSQNERTATNNTVVTSDTTPNNKCASIPPASAEEMRWAAASGGSCSLAQSCLRIALFPWFPLKTNRWRRAGRRGRNTTEGFGLCSHLNLFIWIFVLVFLFTDFLLKQEIAQFQSVCVQMLTDTHTRPYLHLHVLTSLHVKSYLEKWTIQSQMVQKPFCNL